MKIAVRALAVFVLGIIALTSTPQSYAQEAGILEGIRGRAYWKKDPLSQAVRLDPQRDKGRLLRAGESVRCDRGGKLWLRLYNRSLRLRGPSPWFPIPHVPAGGTDMRRQALEEYGRLGGRDRGPASVYSPSSHSKVRPATFEIRWIPKAELQTFTLIIREASPSGREILRQDIADGASGHLISDVARHTLVRYRTERGHGPLLLILLHSRLEIDRVSFFLLSAQNEQSLKQELIFWDKEPEGLWRHLGRARAFILHEMFTEAAEEYEAALAQAPKSIDLLKRTIQAHKRTGNFVREEALTRRLPKGIELP
jgi:hypothetical protein